MTYTPFVRVKVVLAVPDVFREAEGDTLISQKEQTEGDIGKIQRFGAEICQGLFAGQSNRGEGFLTEVFRHTQAMLRRDTFAAFLAQTETGGDTGQLGREPIDDLFVFERIGGREAVGVTDSPVVRVLEPRAHHRQVLGVWHGVFFLRRFDLRGIKHFVVLTQRAEIESLAFGLMRIEMIARRALDDAP